MPSQELFFERNVGGRRIEVVKTYDRSYAREVFASLDNEATKILADALKVTEKYDQGDIPDANSSDYEGFLWEELLEAAQEDVRLDPNLYSFFVVSETRAGKAESLFISTDWPSAESFAKRLADG